MNHKSIWGLELIVCTLRNKKNVVFGDSVTEIVADANVVYAYICVCMCVAMEFSRHVTPCHIVREWA